MRYTRPINYSDMKEDAGNQGFKVLSFYGRRDPIREKNSWFVSRLWFTDFVPKETFNWPHLRVFTH